MTPDGHRWFWNAKFLTVTFDASPSCLVEAERVLRADDAVIRFHTIKVKTTADRFGARNYKNPYIVHDVKKDLDY